VGSVSPVPSRIAHPWRRVSQARLRGSLPQLSGPCTPCTDPAELLLLQCTGKPKTLPGAGHRRTTRTTVGSGFKRNPLTITTAADRVKSLGKSHRLTVRSGVLAF